MATTAAAEALKNDDGVWGHGMKRGVGQTAQDLTPMSLKRTAGQET